MGEQAEAGGPDTDWAAPAHEGEDPKMADEVRRRRGGESVLYNTVTEDRAARHTVSAAYNIWGTYRLYPPPA